MKRIIIFCALIIALLSFGGCDKYLNDTKMVNIETDVNGFKTEAQADQTIVAIYSNIRNRDGLNGRSASVLFDAASADLKIIRESNSVNNYTFNTNLDDQAFRQFWQYMYSIIGRCNSSMELVPKTATPAAKISRYNSEAKVLRAIMYYHLMMTYNTCPLVMKTIDPSDAEGLKKGDATRDEIYTAMIADLEAVIKNADFPWEKDIKAADKGHVGQGTARTILTYFYLTRGWEKNSKSDFDLAKKYAKEIIDLGGFKLEPVLLDAYYKDFSTESIFELAGSNISLGLGSKTTPWFVPLTAFAGATTDEKKYYNGWFKMAMTQYLYDAIEVGDARKYLLANKNTGNNIWAPKFLGGDKYGGMKPVLDDVKDNDKGLSTYQCAKGTGAPQEWHDRVSDGDGSGSCWVIYRLSDVYLLYAEACIKTGGADDEARTYINKVRERSRNAWYAYLPKGNPDIPAHVEGVPADIAATVTGDALLAAMKNERRIELSAEMKKMIDIRRWSLAGAKDLENEVKTFGVWQSKYTWYPKPQDQVDLSQGSIKQNPGY
jgi:hypothetical protein